MAFSKAFKKIMNIVLSVLMVIGLFTVSASVDSAKYEVKAEGTSATLTTGKNFNQAIKRLSGQSTATYSTNDTTITAFERSAAAPTEGVTTADISSTNDGSIVAWFDNGTIYWYSDADTVYMNEYSGGMFRGCNGLASLDVSNFDTSKVTAMNYMFYGCSSLPELDVTNFNTANVTNMNCMFYNCSGISELDISSFNTIKVTDMGYMFRGCSGLATIYTGANWNISKVTSSNYMFGSCANLVGGAGTAWASSNPTDKTYAHIDGGTSNPGYFTAKN